MFAGIKSNQAPHWVPLSVLWSEEEEVVQDSEEGEDISAESREGESESDWLQIWIWLLLLALSLAPSTCSSCPSGVIKLSLHKTMIDTLEATSNQEEEEDLEPVPAVNRPGRKKTWPYAQRTNEIWSTSLHLLMQQPHECWTPCALAPPCWAGLLRWCQDQLRRSNILNHVLHFLKTPQRNWLNCDFEEKLEITVPLPEWNNHQLRLFSPNLQSTTVILKRTLFYNWFPDTGEIKNVFMVQQPESWNHSLHCNSFFFLFFLPCCAQCTT